MLRINTDTIGNNKLTALSGSFTTDDLEPLENHFLDQIEQGIIHHIIDFENLVEFQLSVITPIIKLRNFVARKKGHIILYSLPRDLRMALRITKLDQLFDIRNTLDFLGVPASYSKSAVVESKREEKTGAGDSESAIIYDIPED